MSESHFDVIVLGSGPAGSTIAGKAVEAGRRVAMVESREFGGTCALRGCNPKKVYTNAGSLVDQMRRAGGQLISKNLIADTTGAIDWRQLLAFKREFTEPVARDSEQSFQKDGIVTFQGAASFVDASAVTVDGQQLSAERIVIATGAHPRPLSIPGEEWITRSDEFMELAAIPERILFIGGGYVSMEFANVVARCGKQVTVVDRHSHVLSGFDPDLVGILQSYAENRGIRFELDCDVTKVSRHEDGLLSAALSNGKTLDGDLIVHGAGRTPHIADLNLNAGDVRYNSDGVAVDRFMRSVSNPHVFAAGDCAAGGFPRLTPVANEEARIVAKNLFAEQPEATPDYGSVPKVAFTTPAIASVGISEEQAIKAGRKFSVKFDNTSTWGSVRKTGETVAGYKVLIDEENGQVLGAHLLGPAAEETINLFALAMKFNLTVKDLKSTLFAFPTFASDVRRMI